MAVKVSLRCEIGRFGLMVRVVGQATLHTFSLHSSHPPHLRNSSCPVSQATSTRPMSSGNKYFSFKNAFAGVSGGNGSNDYAKLKSENGFAEQNRKSFHKYSFRFSVRASQRTGFSPQNQENSGFWAQIPKNRCSCLACYDTRTEDLKPHL